MSTREVRVLPQNLTTIEDRIRWLLKAIESGVEVTESAGIESTDPLLVAHVINYVLCEDDRLSESLKEGLEACDFHLNRASVRLEPAGFEPDLYFWITQKEYRMDEGDEGDEGVEGVDVQGPE